MKKLEFAVSRYVTIYPNMLCDEKIIDFIKSNSVNAHIYMIVSHPKVYIKDVIIKNKRLNFIVLFDGKSCTIKYDEDKLDVVLIRSKKYFDSAKLGIEISYDVLDNGVKKNIIKSIYAYDLFCMYSTNIDYKIEYIGQSYGHDGCRTAIDRLSNHSTLQKILAKQASSSQPMEIQILLLEIENIDLTNTFYGIPAPNGFLEFSDSNTALTPNYINLQEAFLINYFKPDYNQIFKDGVVPEKNHSSYKKVIDEEYESFSFSFCASEKIDKTFYTDTNKMVLKNGLSEKVVVDFATANMINPDEYLYSFLNDNSDI